MSMSRRSFLARVGQAGGYSAAFTTMQSLGLMPMRVAAAEPIAAAAGTGKGTRVVVAGGGIAGLVSAYELRKLGYEVTLLEARNRPGGRNWSARKGTVLEFVDGEKQQCNWDEGNYQNLGPGRLPSVHGTMLNYCRELNVPLEVEINTSRSTFLQNDNANGGKPVVQRKAVNDTRGHVSELLAKSIAGGSLDTELTKEDRERMITFLKLYGPLDKDAKYRGSDRAGYKQAAGAGPQVGVVDDPMDMHTLLDENFWNGVLYEETWDWQATMMQPVGGMDRIPYAFDKALGKAIVYDAPVTEIRKTGKGVTVTYKHGNGTKSIAADYLICAMPLSILKSIPADLAAAHKRVIDESTYAGAYKIAWQSRRFWEQDYNIYGGLSFMSPGPTTIVWYPSAKIMSPNGILVTGYEDESNWGFGRLTTTEKFAMARKQMERIHPGHGHELDQPIFCGWKHVPWNEGSWIRGYGGGPAGYDVITQPDGPIYFAGDHTSHIVGWQEGAALSGKRAVQMISDRVKQVPSTGQTAAGKKAVTA